MIKINFLFIQLTASWRLATYSYHKATRFIIFNAASCMNMQCGWKISSAKETDQKSKCSTRYNEKKKQRLSCKRPPFWETSSTFFYSKTKASVIWTLHWIQLVNIQKKEVGKVRIKTRVVGKTVWRQDISNAKSMLYVKKSLVA